MLLAQIMGGIDLSPLLPLWAGGCGAVLAAAAVFWRVAFPTRPALLLGLGIGACLMSALALLLWLWLDLGLPAVVWTVAVPPLSLAVGAWATVKGAKAWR